MAGDGSPGGHSLRYRPRPFSLRTQLCQLRDWAEAAAVAQYAEGASHGERPGVHGPRPECTETIPGRRLQAVRAGMACGAEGRELEVPADVPHRGVYEKEPKQRGLRHSYGAQGLQNDLDRYTGADHVHLSQRKKVQGKPSASSKIRERKF